MTNFFDTISTVGELNNFFLTSRFSDIELYNQRPDTKKAAWMRLYVF